jgi:hypothetical protein
MLADGFDVLITFDKNLQYQQNFKKYSIPVLVLNATDNSYLTLQLLVPQIIDVLLNPLSEGVIEIKQKK